MQSYHRIVAILLTFSVHVFGQESTKCYKDDGTPQRCIPPFVNAAFGLQVEATNTCGEEILYDASGRRYTQSQLDEFKTYYRQTGAAAQKEYLDRCDSNSQDPKQRHDPKYMVDLDAPDNTTWWQSVTLYEYQQRKLGDMVQSTITLNLGKKYDITYIRLRFQSLRPESLAIFKRTSDNTPWIPYQFFSASCSNTYGLPQNGQIPRDRPNMAICTEEYSAISPISGGQVIFSTLLGRPGALQFENSPLLQDFVAVSSIKIELTRMNTFGDEVFRDRAVLQSYYYAISDISIGARCKCNGHSKECVQSSSESGESRPVCLCQHNTGGVDCGECLPFYNNQPWGPATSTDARQCEQCECNGRSERCYFDPDLYFRNGDRDGGHCLDCRDFTAGPNCERCQVNYYRSDPRAVCSACNCNGEGSESLQCSSSGQCRCKAGVTGPKCDRCAPDHYNFGTWGCRACGCVEAGSFENTPYCDNRNGLCDCKANVEGQNCDRCKPGYFNLDLNNKFGCLACFCNGKTSQCTVANGYKQFDIENYFDNGIQDWTGLTRVGDNVPLQYNPFTEEISLASIGQELIYFNAPNDFLNNQKYSYNQFLEFTLRIGEERGRPSQDDIIIEGGDGRSIFTSLISQSNPPPSIEHQKYRFRLHEHERYQWSPSLSALEFHRIMNNITAIKIRATYNTNGVGYLDDVTLGSAHNGQQIGDINSIELCTCPEQYVGQFCESCAPGYRREIPFGGEWSDCVSCECNGHSDSCDEASGECICGHNTTGLNCEKCKEGFYGNPLLGTEDDCTACPCPNQGKCYQQLDGSVSCLSCPEGYGGGLCDVCIDDYFGEPEGMMYGNFTECQSCDCNTNVDTNAVGNCNTTSGVCLKCIYNTGGDYCETCISGFYGNATADEKGDCKPCICDVFGTKPESLDVCELEDGQCDCLPRVTGRRCDQCEPGSWNLESASGCEPCLCDPTGSTGTSCDLTSGQCICKEGVTGRRCDQCVADYFGFSSTGCSYCNCTEIGSANGQCDESGQCVCKDVDRITGLLCDECRENKHNLTAGCVDCPACYNLVQDAVTDIREQLINLEKTLKNINENPNVDDDDFVEALTSVEIQVEELHDKTLTLKNTGAPVSGDLQKIFDEIAKLKKSTAEVKMILQQAGDQYDEIDLETVENRTNTIRDDLNGAKSEFESESARLISSIRDLIDDHGQKSDNMTQLAQQSKLIKEQQVSSSNKIVKEADDANTVANDAWILANQVLKAPQNLSDRLNELENGLAEAQSLVSKVEKSAQQAFDASEEILDKALTHFNTADRAIVTEYDPTNDRKISEEIRVTAEGLLNDTINLELELNQSINQTNIQIALAETSYQNATKEQQVTDELGAEADLALQTAEDAVAKSVKLLNDAQERLDTLREFDERVQRYKQEAEDALKLIAIIEGLLEQAENKTILANLAVQGANETAAEAQQMAAEAQTKAEKAAKDAGKLLTDVEKLEKQAETKRSDIEDWEDKINKLEDEIEIRELAVKKDSKIVKQALDDSDQARVITKSISEDLSKSVDQVNEIIAKLENLAALNTTELERLETELAEAESKYNALNIDQMVKDLQEFSSDQRVAIVGQREDLKQLILDVNNIQLIVETTPGTEKCFAKPNLEPSLEGTRRQRKRLRRLRKRLRL